MNTLKSIVCLLLVAVLTAPALASGVSVQRQVTRQRGGLLSGLFANRQVQRQVVIQQYAPPLVQRQVVVEQQYVQPQVILRQKQYVVPQLQLQQKFLQQQGGCYQGQCGQVLQQQSYGIW